MSESEGRELGSLEYIYYLLDEFLPANMIVVVSLAGPCDQVELRHRLNRAQQKLWFLSSRIQVRRNGLPSIMVGEVPPIPLRVVKDSSRSWTTYAESELAEPLPLHHGPLARCMLVLHEACSSTLILTVSHAILDGESCGLFLKTLMGRSDEVPQETLLNMPFEKRIPPTLKRKFRWPEVQTPKLQYLRTSDLYPTGSVRIVPVSIEETLLRSIKLAARRNRTTLHGALCAALLIGFSQVTGFGRVSISSAINLRGKLSIPKDEPGMFSVPVPVVYRIKEPLELWSLARELREQLNSKSKRGEPLVYASSIRPTREGPTVLPSIAKHLARYRNRRWNEHASALSDQHLRNIPFFT
jgi:hypothetical protein